MIGTIQSIAPKIDFGQGRVTLQAQAGQPVVVWLQTVYNKSYYTFTLQTTGTVIKISDYEYHVTFSTPGTYTVQMAVARANKKETPLMSNILDLTVIQPNG